MYIKFLVLFVTSVALWQVAKSFVIKNQESMVDFTQPAHVVFNTVPSPLVIDEDDKLPVQSVQESENKADDVKDDDDDKNLNGDMHEEQESMSPSGEIEDVPSSARHGKGVDNIKLTSKDDEYEEEKNEKHQDVQKDINESDEGREKPHRNKDSHHEEADETEMENDESANKDSLDNDD